MKTEILTAKIPKDLKRKLRRRAIIENKSMTELVIQALTSFLDGDGSYENGSYLDQGYYDKRIEELASEVEKLRSLLVSHGIIPEERIQKEPNPGDGSYVNEPKEEGPVHIELPEGLREDVRELLDNPWASILTRKGRDKHG
ncbi:MAG: hypothetical protein DRO00_08290 [Thermoproteota archaeon]|nr:MAG: hypothetical protein DRO00_08290 [Candidatus Korarchaeota archaeon]